MIDTWKLMLILATGMLQERELHGMHGWPNSSDVTDQINKPNFNCLTLILTLTLTIVFV